MPELLILTPQRFRRSRRMAVGVCAYRYVRCTTGRGCVPFLLFGADVLAWGRSHIGRVPSPSGGTLLAVSRG
ncbi:hypothetical protein [Streptomyces sp. NPDC058451]|uniref:hypothetical protein n=2 Tax=unclassified Streptomyces TaxID=2593676 RepID=UPI00366929E9